jgi:hypothetical protein
MSSIAARFGRTRVAEGHALLPHALPYGNLARPYWPDQIQGYSHRMDIVSLKQRLDRANFLPFRIHLADGRSFDVLQPDWTWVIPPFRRVFIARPQLGRGRWCPIEEIDVLFITSIEELPPAQQGGAAAA